VPWDAAKVGGSWGKGKGVLKGLEWGNSRDRGMEVQLEWKRAVLWARPKDSRKGQLWVWQKGVLREQSLEAPRETERVRLLEPRS
jgi:hypothetical protein